MNDPSVHSTEELLDGVTRDESAIHPDQIASPSPEGAPGSDLSAKQGEATSAELATAMRELEERLANSLPKPTGPDDEVARAQLLEALGRPASPEDYAIEPPHPLLSPDAKLNGRLHAAGFTGHQAQLVYDLAAEFLLPLVDEVRSELRAERELDKLHASFGGKQQWAMTAEQLRAWGQANLDPETYSTLSSTAEGVLAMVQIMKSREPQLAAGDDATGAALDEEALNAMVRDPRYWRTRDPEFIARVTAGFERLFSR